MPQAWERQKLERLCRYITRAEISEKRLSVEVTPAKRSKGHPCEQGEDKDPAQGHQAMTWAQLTEAGF
jgi:hypothetical protein